MNCFKVALRDLKRISKSKFISVCLLAIIIVPILYSLLYLGAFWDPYGKMQDMPVAVVNLDEGFTIDGVKYNFGEDFVSELKNNEAVKWVFVSEDEADNGLEGDKYYAKFQISKDFSKNVTSAKVGLPVQAKLTFTSNEKKNFLAAQVCSKVQSELKNTIIKSVSEEYVTKTFESLYSAKDGFVAAADGSKALEDGMNSLSSNIPALEDGANALSNGMNNLYTSYTNTVFPNIIKLSDGTSTLNSALIAAEGDISKLSKGATSVSQGSETVINGYSTVQNGYLAVYNGTNTLISSAKSTSALMTSIATKLQTAMVQYQGGDTTKLAPAVMEVLTNLQTYSTQNSNATKQLEALVQGLDGLKVGMETYNTGLNTYVNGSKQVADGTNSLIGKVSTIKNGVSELNNGMSQLKTGLSSQFGPGLGKLDNGMVDLTSNLPALKDGVTKLNDGSKELAEKLNTGAITLDDGLINKSEDMGKFVSEPIELDVASSNPVPNYGNGFAPYFINLSLWIGGLMIFFVISTKVDMTTYEEGTSNFAKVIGRYLLAALVGVIQAVLLGCVILALGLRPASYVLYFGMTILSSIVYVGIIYSLVTLLGDAGRLISIILLIIQLTTCGGTFPLELIPKVFGVLNPYFPFTYSVEALKEACFATTMNYGMLIKDSLILLGFLVVFQILAVVFRKFGSKKTAQMEALKMK